MFAYIPFKVVRCMWETGKPFHESESSWRLYSRRLHKTFWEIKTIQINPVIKWPHTKWPGQIQTVRSASTLSVTTRVVNPEVMSCNRSQKSMWHSWFVSQQCIYSLRWKAISCLERRVLSAHMREPRNTWACSWIWPKSINLFYRFPEKNFYRKKLICWLVGRANVKWWKVMAICTNTTSFLSWHYII